MYLVDPVHVILKLLQILDVSVADLANHEPGAALLPGLACPRLLRGEARTAVLPLADGLQRRGTLKRCRSCHQTSSVRISKAI